MKKLLSTLLTVSLFVVGSSFAEEKKKFESLTTLKGKEYNDVTVTSVSPSQLKIMHASGVATILFEDLPAEIKSEFGFDPKKAVAHKAKIEAELKVVKAKKAEEAAQRKLAATAENKAFYVFQLAKTGLLVNDEVFAGGASSSLGGVGGGGGVASGGWGRGSDIFFVEGFPAFEDLTDKQRIEGRFYKDGNHSYQTVTGAKKTVARFVWVGKMTPSK